MFVTGGNVVNDVGEEPCSATLALATLAGWLDTDNSFLFEQVFGVFLLG